MRLVSVSMVGNCHEAVMAINKLNLARFVLCMECNGSYSTNVVFRTEGELEWHHLRNLLGLTYREYSK